MKRFIRVTAVFFLMLCLTTSLGACYRINEKSTSLAHYDDSIERIGANHTILFPERELPTEENSKLIYRYLWNGSDAQEYVLYLDCVYSETEFQAELSRLAENATMYSEDIFQQPAYIYCLDYIGTNQYALLDMEKKEIRYITYRMYWGLRFSDDLLPEEYAPKREYRDTEIRPHNLNVSPTEP